MLGDTIFRNVYNCMILYISANHNKRTTQYNIIMEVSHLKYRECEITFTKIQILE